MALQLSKADIVRMRERAERLQAYAKRTLERSKEVVTTVVTTIEVTAAAFGWGVVKGKWGEVEIFGAPLTLVAGLSLHVLAFFGVAGNMGSHLHALGDGTLASWASTTGIAAGDAWRLKAGGGSAALPGGKTSGDDIEREISRAMNP